MTYISIDAPTYLVSATTTSAAATLTPQDSENQQVTVYNAGSTEVAVQAGGALGGSAPTAVFPDSATAPRYSAVVPPGGYVTFSKPAYAAFVSCIRASGTGNVYITIGSGE